MYNYSLLECLAALAVVFLIGYPVFDSGCKDATTTTGSEAKHT